MANTISNRTYTAVDALYESGYATFNKVVNRISHTSATAMIQQNVDEQGNIELVVPMDTPKWLRAKAEGISKMDERKTRVLARLKARQQAKGK